MSANIGLKLLSLLLPFLLWLLCAVACLRTRRNARWSRVALVAFVVLVVGDVLVTLAHWRSIQRLVDTFRASLDESAARPYVMTVDGQVVPERDAIIREMRTIVAPRYNHSPPLRTFHVRISSNDGDQLSVVLVQDSAAPDEFWVYWPPSYPETRVGTIESEPLRLLLDKIAQRWASLRMGRTEQSP
jgi:hypothetical protein